MDRKKKKKKKKKNEPDVTVQFSSAQDGIYALEKAHNYALRPVSQKSAYRCPGNSSNAV